VSEAPELVVAAPDGEAAARAPRLPAGSLATAGLAVALVAAAWAPGLPVLTVLLAFLAAVAALELAGALELDGWDRRALPLLTGLLVLGAGLLPPRTFVGAWMLALLLALAGGTLALPPDTLGRRTVGLAAGGVLLPLGLASHLWLWRGADGPGRATLLVVAVVAGRVVAGLAAGLSADGPPRGGRWAGEILGVAAAAVLGAALAGPAGSAPAVGGAIGAAAALAGAAGDRSAVVWKQALGVRAWSRLLGSFGGVLDALAPLVLAGPLVYLLSWALAARP
jgi:hypothetical protein